MRLYEYLIGGRKTGKRDIIHTFGELKRGDVLYFYKFDGDLRRIDFEERTILSTPVKDNKSATFIISGPKSESDCTSTQEINKSIKVWDTNWRNMRYGAVTAYLMDNDDVKDEIRKKFKK